MQIFFSFYQLKRKRKSNSRVSSQFQSGVLIKVVDDDGAYGVADLCPWPELGDLTLQLELDQKGPLFHRAMELAQIDLQARKTQKRLISSAAIKNHILVTDFENFVFPVQPAILKIKGTKNFRKLAEWINHHFHHALSLRLDFNSCLHADEFGEFISLLSESALKKIEIVEDPCPFDFEKWTEFQKKIPLAIDFEKGSWPHKVVKPVRQEVPNDALYLTSSMDHPVGVAHGIVFAQCFPQKTHGFLTLDMYEKNKYSQSFTQVHDQLTFQSDWSGIGFSLLLEKENWIPDLNWENHSKSIILYNPQASIDEIKNIFSVKKEFLINHPTDYILVPSSGSTQGPGDLKIFSFHKESILNSAERVVRHFNLAEDMNWGCVLPLYHVGGLGILARSYIAKSKVFYSAWTEFSVDWIVDNRIQLLSLVPTQVFDIVQCRLQAPADLKYVFIGGASLDSKIEDSARELGWPLVLTYGMTETASMIAAKNSQGNFEPFSGVKLIEKDGRNFIKTDSLAFSQINFKQGLISEIIFSENQFGIELPDLIEKKTEDSFAVLGRIDDQVKINGELVNLSRFKDLFPAELSEALVVVAVADQRKGRSLVLLGERVPLFKLRQTAERINQTVKKFERISFIVTLDMFPRTVLNKIKLVELKNQIELSQAYEKL